MYNVGDKLTLIKEIKYKYSTIEYTIGDNYRIMKIQGNIHYLENDEKSSNRKDWGIWDKDRLDIYFKNLRQERLEKLKQIDESNYGNI